MTVAVTDTQAKVLAFIRQYRTTNQMPPTCVEIARHFKWRSVNAAHEILRRLEKAGAIRLIPGVPRGIFDLETV
ncbi:LexA DNA binding domain-containing protein [Roseateles sp. YR242]|uniref:LexA family protein n=1 Tax=Roseateles sp. YR242 TaxID=1855305 RepID=UPI0008BC9054|nr:hypothetical protein [Roseateles sp. YR242]SEL13038.1 LexA DNA binding domain-containing protein [Roseateles sp. YR242]